MKLYEHPESGNSHKVRLLLAFLSVPYESVSIDLMTDEQHGEAFLELNPRGEVPVLVDGGLVLRDSMAILFYLASKHGDGRWLPSDPAGQARVLEWLAFAASWIQYGVFSARAIVAFGIPANGLPPDFATSPREGQERGRHSLEILEKALAREPWLTGAGATIADVACFPYVALAPMGDVSLEPFPAVCAWIERFKALPGYLDMPGIEDPAYRSAP